MGPYIPDQLHHIVPLEIPPGPELIERFLAGCVSVPQESYVAFRVGDMREIFELMRDFKQFMTEVKEHGNMRPRKKRCSAEVAKLVNDTVIDACAYFLSSFFIARHSTIASSIRAHLGDQVKDDEVPENVSDRVTKELHRLLRNLDESDQPLNTVTDALNYLQLPPIPDHDLRIEPTENANQRFLVYKILVQCKDRLFLSLRPFQISLYVIFKTVCLLNELEFSQVKERADYIDMSNITVASTSLLVNYFNNFEHIVKREFRAPYKKALKNAELAEN